MIEGGRLFCIPYDMNRGPGEKNTLFLNHMVRNRMWFSGSLTDEEARVNTAWMMANPEWFKWEVWNGGRLAGMLVLHRVIPPVDAIFHFGFFGNETSGVSLFGGKKLIWNFLGYAFEAFGLRRITMEIPEHYPTLIKFARQKLGFRYEGELDLDRYSKVNPNGKGAEPSMRAALALHGSRREGSHWNEKDQKWEDVILLRLLRSEYEARRSLDTTTRESPIEDSNVVRLETSAVRATST